MVWTTLLILHSKVWRYRSCYIAVPLNSVSLNVKIQEDWKATVSTLSTFRSVGLRVTRESCGGCRQRILDNVDAATAFLVEQVRTEEEKVRV